MDLSSAVQWWEEWQLRILVLGSLFVQIILCFSWVRKLSFKIPVMRVLRVLVWLAYIGGDALAIYALATLFNRHNQHQHQQKRFHTLEVLWAPVLLIHLGGQFMISAYSLEDTELWMRHAMTIVSQVTIACYVFYKQWPGSGGESRLLQAAVLLFIVGILKFGQKPWILWSASFNSLLASTTTKTKSSSPPRKCSRIWTIWWWCISFLPSRPLGTEGGDEEGPLSLQEYVMKAVTDEAAEAASNHSDISSMIHHTSYICKMFVDMPVRYSGRLRELRSFQRLVLDGGERAVYLKLQGYLLRTYYLLYSWQRSTLSILGMFLRALLFPLLALAAALLFSKSRKDGYDEDDVRVTYILFYCTAVLEFIHIFAAAVPSPCLAPYGYGNWSSMVYQHSLLSFCARKEQPPMEMKLTACLCSLAEYINKHCYIQQVPEALPITELVCRHVTNDGWKNYVRDAASYRRFNNLRGQRAMSLSLTRQQHHLLRQRLGRSLDDVPFDESVLLWHIATDLCLHHQSNTPPGQRQGHADADAAPRRRSKEISNYMIYLLFIRPEMLMPGTRTGLFTEASHEIELILDDREAPQSSNTEEGSFARRIMHAVMMKLSSPDANTVKETTGLFIGQACLLANTLITLLVDEKERWQLIQGVWVEMLCYSASRCRGYLHARSLGEGGEYLSYVCLLWFLMGMETLADRHQMPEPPQHEEEEEGDAWASGSRGRAHGLV